MLIINTGDGKGKTTSAIGIVLRSLVLNKKVLIIQFMKPQKEKSIEFLCDKFPNLVCYNHGINKFISANNVPLELTKKCQLGFEDLKANIDKFDLIFVDELFSAIYFKLLDQKEVLDFILSYKNKDFILTGRKCPKEFIDIADIVSEMKKIKHHYDKGILAKEGIDY